MHPATTKKLKLKFLNKKALFNIYLFSEYIVLQNSGMKGIIMPGITRIPSLALLKKEMKKMFEQFPVKEGGFRGPLKHDMFTRTGGPFERDSFTRTGFTEFGTLGRTDYDRFRSNRKFGMHSSIDYDRFSSDEEFPTILSDANLANYLRIIEERITQGFGKNTRQEARGLNFIKKKLDTCNGIILGDGDHNTTYQHDFLSRNLDALKAKGVKKIYLEFLANTHADALNRFYETGDISDLTRILTLQVNTAEGALPLIKLCREKGIRCYDLDIRINNFIERSKYWAQRVSQTNPDGDKYILVGGSGHLSRQLKAKGLDANEGIDKLLPGKIAVLEGEVPSLLEKRLPPRYTELSENYAVLRYKNH